MQVILAPLPLEEDTFGNGISRKLLLVLHLPLWSSLVLSSSSCLCILSSSFFFSFTSLSLEAVSTAVKLYDCLLHRCLPPHLGNATRLQFQPGSLRRSSPLTVTIAIVVSCPQKRFSIIKLSTAQAFQPIRVTGISRQTHCADCPAAEKVFDGFLGGIVGQGSQGSCVGWAAGQLRPVEVGFTG